MSKDKEIGVRHQVASNPSSSPSSLAFLAKDKEMGTRYRVARNPKTPIEVLLLLAKDPLEDVAIEAEKNFRKRTGAEIAL